MVPQLVGQRVPGFQPPVELVVPSGERREGAVVENDPALNAFHAPAQLDRKGNALSERKGLRPLGMRHHSRGDHDFRDPLEEVGRNLVAQTPDHRFEIHQTHRHGVM
jgi:hypothetical protein